MIDKSRKEPKLIILTDKITDEIVELRDKFSNNSQLNCFSDRGIERISQSEIIRIYSQNGSVFVDTSLNTYSLHERLYEAEEKLDKSLFLRISKSEIVNSGKIIRLNIKLSGTIGIELTAGIVSYVSRRYVPKIKDFFGL